LKQKQILRLIMTYQIFISLRFAEAGKEAEALKTALEARGISTFLCAVQAGGDIAREIVNALHGCQLAIIMGTRTYGKDTGVGFSTFEELRFIHKKKPFFLIKMCEMFEEPETVFRLGDSVSWFQWISGRPMPEDLVPKIVEKLASITPSSTPLGSELSEKLPSPVPSSTTIPLESLAVPESIELLIHLGCSAEVRKRVKALGMVMDGYLQGIDEVELLQELEDNNSRLRKPVLNGILTKLKKFQENGIPSDILNEAKNRIEEGECKHAEQKQIREEELRRKAEQEAILAERRAEEEKLAKDKLQEDEERPKIPTFSGHSDQVYSVIQLLDGRLASGSNDKTIKIWNINSETCARTLSGHDGYVSGLIQLSDGRLASGSDDKTIKIWNINNGSCEITLSGRNGPVCSLIQLSDGRLASTSSHGAFC
jgi:hypothetical protein